MVMFQKIVLLLMVFACAHAKLSYNQEQQNKEDEVLAAAVLRENDVALELPLGFHKKSDGIVINAIEYEGIIDPDTKLSIIIKLDSIGSWLNSEEKEGRRRYNKCPWWCNDMKNWYSAASNMKTVEAQWKTKIDTTTDSSDAFKKWGQDSINGIKNGSNTCWGGFGCKDSTEYNRIYKDMANRLQNILDDKSFTDSPTAAPTQSSSVSPTAAPTPSPTFSPTAAPTTSPTFSPTAAPTPSPTGGPTAAPTPSPTFSPTAAPTSSPTVSPTAAPTPSPTFSPTAAPTPSPTVSPTADPTSIPTVSPTAAPTPSPSVCKDDGHFYTCGIIKEGGYCAIPTAKSHCFKTCGYCNTISEY